MAMTIKELYDYARAMGRENFKIRLQYQDAGGPYDGSCEMENVSRWNDKENALHREPGAGRFMLKVQDKVQRQPEQHKCGTGKI